MPNPKLETYKNKATNTVYDLTDADAQSKLTAILDGTDIDSFGDVESALANKVDKVSGKGLSTNDYDASAKSKLDNLANIKSIGTGLDLDESGELSATGAEITIDSAMSSSSTNPVQNKVITSELAGKQDTLTFDNFPTANSSNPVKSGGVKSATTEIWGVIGPIEAGITSAHAYEVGDHFECYYGYVTVIAPIAVNDTIENNVNVVGGTIASTMTQDAKDAFPRDEQAVLGAVNVLNHSATSQTLNTCVITVDAENRTIEFDGTPTGGNASLQLITAEQINALLAKYGDLFLSGCPSGGDENKYSLFTRYGENNFDRDTDNGVWLRASRTYDRPLYAQVIRGTVADHLVFKPMLSKSDKSPYAPYAMTNKELTEKVQGIINAATNAADFAAFKTAIGNL